MKTAEKVEPSDEVNVTVSLTPEQLTILGDFASAMGFTFGEAAHFLLLKELQDWYAVMNRPERA